MSNRPTSTAIPVERGCSKAEPKKIAPPQTPFPGTRDGQNLISWRWSLPLPTDPVWRVIMVKEPHTHTNSHTHRQTGPITIHCAAAIAPCKNKSKKWKPLTELFRSSTVREGSQVGASRLWLKKFFWKRWVLSLEWNSECVMEGESGGRCWVTSSVAIDTIHTLCCTFMHSNNLLTMDTWEHAKFNMGWYLQGVR